jgi:hypothetical protein
LTKKRKKIKEKGKQIKGMKIGGKNIKELVMCFAVKHHHKSQLM